MDGWAPVSKSTLCVVMPSMLVIVLHWLQNPPVVKNGRGVIVGSPWQEGAGGCIASCLFNIHHVATSELFAIVVLDDDTCMLKWENQQCSEPSSD